MKKMKTLYVKDKKDLSRVLDGCLDPDCAWVFDEGVRATRKFDGTACAIIKGKLYKRYDNKKGKKMPPEAIECQGPDEFTGHHPYWVPVTEADKWHIEALKFRLGEFEDGTYELCGRKVQGNPEGIEGFHELIKHGSIEYDTKEVLANPKLFIADKDIEGIVFHHPDGRMCKIRKKDFGMKRV